MPRAEDPGLRKLEFVGSHHGICEIERRFCVPEKVFVGFRN
jgi:hypothetical protein